MPDASELIVRDRAAWRRWLVEHCSLREGVWFVLSRQGAIDPTSLRYQEALEEALCFGWIDGQVRRRDETSYRQRFTPRRPRSAWSKRNVEIVKRLLDDGRMAPSGVAEMERALADGRWEVAYAGPAQIDVPPDLDAALTASPRARAAFEVLTSQNRYAILYRLATAKREETRARRLASFVVMLEEGRTPHPQKRRPGEQPEGPPPTAPEDSTLTFD